MSFTLQIRTGTEVNTLTVNEGDTAGTVLRRLGYSSASSSLLINGRVASDATTIREGDNLQILPKAGKNGAFQVQIAQGSQTHMVTVSEDTLVRDALARAGISGDVSVTSAGRPVALTATVRQGEILNVLPKAGKNGAFQVTINSGCQSMVVTANDSTNVDSALRSAGISPGNSTVTIGGRPVQMNTTVREGDVLNVLPKAGKNGAFQVTVNAGTQSTVVSVTEDTTVGRVIERAGASSSAVTVTIGGRPVQMSTTVREGDVLNVLPKAGKNG